MRRSPYKWCKKLCMCVLFTLKSCPIPCRKATKLFQGSCYPVFFYDSLIIKSRLNDVIPWEIINKSGHNRLILREELNSVFPIFFFFVYTGLYVCFVLLLLNTHSSTHTYTHIFHINSFINRHIYLYI